MTHAEIFKNSTICAVASSSGAPSALAIIRLSGPLSHQIVGKIFRPVSKASLLPHRIYLGSIYENERTVDEVLVHIASAPSSFTGEDTAEITCHGSLYVVQEIMRIAMEAGASPALPGEFSQRAFLNGKIDLAQAEAIADLIASENEAAHRLAMEQMRGGFSAQISNLRSSLVDFTSLIELELDFSEEDVTFADRTQLLNLLAQVIQTIESLCKSFSLGNVLKKGVPTAIVGATNVGKSTLLNALLDDERAIVSDIHGTTRDTIEEETTINGVCFRFIDTAGLRESQEEIEKMGIERSHQKIRTAAILLPVIDVTHPELFRKEIHQIAAQIDIEQQQVIVVLNKYDTINDKDPIYNNGVILCNSNSINTADIIYNDLISNIINIFFQEKVSPYAIATVSAKYKMGIDSLKALLSSAIEARFDAAKLAPNAILVTNLRHLSALEEAKISLNRVREGLSSTLPTDLIAQDLRQALYDLGTITGDVSTEEILGNIFGKFCIGK